MTAGMTARDILTFAADVVHLAYARNGAISGAVKDAATAALAILTAIADIMDTHNLTCEELIRSIERIPDWLTQKDDQAIDRQIDDLPSRK